MAVIDSLQIMEMSNALTSKENAIEILENFLLIISRPSHQQLCKLKSRSEDPVAKSLLPHDFKEWSPLTTTGDGNCLFNSSSILICGNQSLAGILRLLTVAELFVHAELYAEHPQMKDMADVSGYSVLALMHILLSDDEAERIYYGESINAANAVESLARRTAKPFVCCKSFSHSCPGIRDR